MVLSENFQSNKNFNVFHEPYILMPLNLPENKYLLPTQRIQ